MNKRLLVGVAATGLLTSLAGAALAVPTYTTPCGDTSRHQGAAPLVPSVRHSNPAQAQNGGFLEITGQGGYLDAQGHPGNIPGGQEPTGGVDGMGTQPGVGKIYGHFNDSSICVGVDGPTGNVIKVQQANPLPF